MDVEGDHIKIWYEGNSNPVALVSKFRRKIIVQFLDDAIQSKEEKEAVIRELDLYLNGLDKENPWAYAVYHTSTGSNLYSDVQWGFFPRGFVDR